MTESKPEVGVLHKSLDIIERLAAAEAVDSGLTVAELAKESEVSRAAAYRILNTLESRSYVMRADNPNGGPRQYRLGSAIRALATQLTTPEDVLTACGPVLRHLWGEFGETVNLGVMNDDEIVYLEILESDQGLRTSASVGSRHPVHATALGKALLARMPRSHARDILQRTDLVRLTPKTLVTIQELVTDIAETSLRGYAIDDEESETGARCVAAAIPGRDETPLAAISVSAPAWRMPDAIADKIGRRLVAEAKRISGRF